MLNKVIDRIDELAARFIAASPFAVIASRNGDGHLDLSPKGDAAGSFVRVIRRSPCRIGWATAASTR